MEELLKKEEGFTSWRFKLNRILGRISELLKGSKGKCVLTNVDGVISWEPVEEREIETRNEVSSLKVEGVLTATNVSINGIANFDCNVTVSSNIEAKGMSLTDVLVMKGNGRSEAIYATEKGLTLGSIVAGSKSVELPSMLLLGQNATIGATKDTVSIYGKACPMKLNTENGYAEFPYGVKTRELYLSNGLLNEKSYSGNAATATRLKSPVKIFGNDFTGERELTGQIKDCSGIILNKGSKLMFIHGIGSAGAGWFECNGNTLEWTGRLRPKSLNVITEHYASWYDFDEKMDVGDVISLNFNSETEAYAKVNSTKKHPLGVVTNDYAIAVGRQTEKSYPVCNKGRVKAKVEGPVKLGDNLTVGSLDGVLRAMNSKDKAYEAWAVALEHSDNEEVKLVKIHII